MNTTHLVSGSLVGGMLLVAGCCIGAGMLALPILTGLAGFFPSFSILLLAWAFMTFTGLLLIEATGWFPREIHLLSMTQESLGRPGRMIAWSSYLFLFYSLLVAYIAASGAIFSAIFESLFSIHLAPITASVIFTFISGWIIYLGTRPVDLFNRYLMGGLIVTYLGMIALGLSKIDPKLLLQWNPKYLFSSLPVLVISFGFQNMIPSLTAYMKGDLQKVRLTIIGGSLMTLAVYLIWSFFILGIVPYDNLLTSYEKGEEATIALHNTLGNSAMTHLAQGFAFFAIATSFLAQGLTLAHFLSDGLKNKFHSGWMVLLALTPPLIFALSYPQIFFKALNFAGGICAMILFGILPVAMVWIGRYSKNIPSNYHVRGGKASLACSFCFSSFIIICELARIFS
ncbi:MAG TPA: aromatic amino acid transport family protein [Chlamydiales bacterium]|nr:aromatic amino acid transport family protein [Chlamydiales bacterium]